MMSITAFPFGGVQILNEQVVGSWPPVVPATPLLRSTSAIGRASYNLQSELIRRQAKFMREANDG